MFLRLAAKSSQNGNIPKEIPFGRLVLDAIRRAVERTIQLGKSLPLPGEGDERPFRDWLKSNVLVAVLGWPNEKIRIGEKFDILLLDEHDHPVATIETKAPLHRSTAQEQQTFRERLKLYPSLRNAFFTNGPEWERLDLLAQEGLQEIRARMSLEVSQATDEQTESFFAPLRGDRYFHWGKRNRSRVTRAQPHILEGLARDLDTIVQDITDFFRSLFEHYEKEETGTPVRNTTRSIFEDWCHRSLQASPQQVMTGIMPVLESTQPDRTALTAVLREQGFTPRQADSAADRLLALQLDHRLDSEHVLRALLLLYDDAIRKLCAQSAHVVLARALVYRIGEDMKLFEPLLGGDAMEAALTQSAETIAGEPTPALSLLESTQKRMNSILPLVYELSDLDWWYIPMDKKAGMKPSERAFVVSKEKELDIVVARMLRILDDYYFADVDADVWRNVYQHYLPEDERQRLGGFYTPQELVEFILDLAEYKSEAEGLCRRTVMDLACGSGAFVSVATVRLLEHLASPMPCHSMIKRKRVPQWEENRLVLETVLKNIHAVDIHPFAAFLTTLNLTFLLLHNYAIVHRENPTFGLNFQVFATDSLEKPEEQSLTHDMFEQLNSRIQLTARSYERYRALLNTSFDLICGNPPWGGVLKGPLAPVFKEDKKRRFKREYPNAATGKYDIYGLFIERGLQLLSLGGRLALVTQDTYLDKEWAKSLRELMGNKAEVQTIVDLNPFGQLFFKAMNTPAVIVCDKRVPKDGRFVAVVTRPPKFEGRTPEERRQYVLETILSSIEKLSGRRRSATVNFATAARLPRQMLKETASKRWNLTPGAATSVFKKGWLSVADVLEPRQGVTPGGCLDVFLMSESQANALGLESELVHRAIKTREAERWHLKWEERVLLYPYIIKGDEALPAFALKQGILSDALDFDTILDDHERAIRRGRLLDNATAREILEHRIALGLVRYPQAARYLVQQYTRLEGRIFEKRRFTQLGKRWYEYHRPRDPKLLLGHNHIVSPTLAREVRFALDTEGFLADHACQYLLPSKKTAKVREQLRQALSKVLGRDVSILEVLKYCLAFLNSPFAQEALVSRRPTPKGSYQISEEFLKEIPIVLASERDDVEMILESVKRLTKGMSGGERAVMETRLSQCTMALLSAE